MERIEERTDAKVMRGTERASSSSRAAAHGGVESAAEGRAVWPLAATRSSHEGSAGSCGDRAPMRGRGAAAVSCVRPAPSAVAPSRTARTARALRRALVHRGPGDSGAATAEYAIATMAAVAFAGLLVVILQSDEVRGMLLDLVRRALTYDR
jgi:hypothetical protein